MAVRVQVRALFCRADTPREPFQGFQQQTKGWPQRPVDVAIAWLKSQPPDLRVADFGCGDIALALAVPQRVACLDLVATVPGVIACNMSDTPLGELLLSAIRSQTPFLRQRRQKRNCLGVLVVRLLGWEGEGHLQSCRQSLTLLVGLQSRPAWMWPCSAWR